MAQVHVSDSYLLECLFDGALSGVNVEGCTWDTARRVLLLRIEGESVPSGDVWCNAVMHRRSTSVEIVPVGG
jgi:hypothetical protein